MQFYSHLWDNERDQIGILRAAGRSMGAIARALGRAKTTISRELQRNALSSGGYSPLHAAGAYQLRRRREAILEREAALRLFVGDPRFWSEARRELGEADLNVLSKLGSVWNGVLNPGVYRGVRLVVRTISWISWSDVRSISRWRGSHRRRRPLAFSTPPFCHRGISVAEPGRHVAHGPEQTVLGEGGVVVEGD